MISNKLSDLGVDIFLLAVDFIYFYICMYGCIKWRFYFCLSLWFHCWDFYLFCLLFAVDQFVFILNLYSVADKTELKKTYSYLVLFYGISVLYLETKVQYT